MYGWQFTGIRHFTPSEVEATGARLADVKRVLIATLDTWRHKIGRPVCLLPNGITTGAHLSPEHKNGLAVDVAYYDQGDDINVSGYTMEAISCGFRGIGWYWNGTALSTHLDLGDSFRQWLRWRHHGEPYNENRTDALIQDPRTLERK